MNTENNEKQVLISFVIPAYNEEDSIGKTLISIREFTPDQINYEVIVVDNGSIDNTAQIACSLGAKVKCIPLVTIASARNFGARDAKGDVLIFVDSDILLTKDWSRNILKVITSLLRDKLLVTGSRVLPVDNISFLNKYWFYRMTTYDAPYINSAHLITSKDLFHLIGGFSADLKTAEDYDFCMKAKKVGSKIVNDSSLPVIHLGYPKTISAFMKRERWHGRQDFNSISSFIESKIAWLATFNILSFILFILLSVWLGSYSVLLLYPLIMWGFSALLTMYKFGLTPLSLLMGTSLLFYFYLCGRSMALIDRFLK